MPDKAAKDPATHTYQEIGTHTHTHTHTHTQTHIPIILDTAIFEFASRKSQVDNHPSKTQQNRRSTCQLVAVKIQLCHLCQARQGRQGSCLSTYIKQYCNTRYGTATSMRPRHNKHPGTHLSTGCCTISILSFSSCRTTQPKTLRLIHIKK
jgi:hypothetical protein